MACPICGAESGGSEPSYPNLVCDECDRRAVNAAGDPAIHGNEYLDTETVIDRDEDGRDIRLPPDIGDNPVFIDGRKCWRRYRFGGWVTMLDEHDCDSLKEFYETHGIP